MGIIATLLTPLTNLMQPPLQYSLYVDSITSMPASLNQP